ncbi:hypothetical protein [Hymenobacter metallilatus]|uniref:Uncharacterized protein n=1 Tax=Hymenobacter metallilatus TaxID=2493666 RepID=A0A3R9M7X0_9BACT|nr:hypothetical protein [Hymenobacter metallilatus]RSK24681.1 hypothetical protein EI290_18660 [Hymenobacter metallilatus]
MKSVIAILIIAILVILSTSAAGQSFAQKDSIGIDDFWYKYYSELRKRVGAEDIEKSVKSEFFRAWLNEVVLEVWRNESKLGGSLIHWVEEYIPDGEEATDRYFVVKDDLDSLTCVKILHVIDKFRIRKMPSSQYINGWENGFDGIEYIIEDKIKNNYKFKNYWTPSVQVNVPEADILEKFIKELMIVVNEKERSKYFYASIPFHSWMNGGATIASRVVTHGEAMRMKQERNRYRRLKKKHLLVK